LAWKTVLSRPKGAELSFYIYLRSTFLTQYLCRRMDRYRYRCMCAYMRRAVKVACSLFCWQIHWHWPTPDFVAELSKFHY